MSGKTPAQCSVCKMQKMKKSPITRFALSLYSAQISKNTKIPSIPIIHEGKKNGKMQKVGNAKSGSIGSQKGLKITNAGSNFHRVRKFRTLRNFSRLHLPCLFASSFLLISDLQCRVRHEFFVLRSKQQIWHK